MTTNTRSSSKSTSVSSPQKRTVNWTLLGILILCMPLAWCILCFIWYFVYGGLFHPPSGESNYDWSGLFIILAAIASGVFAVPIGIVILVLRKRLSPPAAVARKILGVLAIGVLVCLVLFSVGISLTWGGATLANRPNLSSKEGYTALTEAIEAVMKTSDVSWKGEYKLKKFVNYNRECPWGNQFIESPYSHETEGTVLTTPDAVIQSSKKALESVGWSVSVYDERYDEMTYRFVNGTKSDVGKVKLYITPENVVNIGIESACFND